MLLRVVCLMKNPTATPISQIRVCCLLVLIFLFMAIFIWNCQGAGSLSFLRSLKFPVKQERAEFVVLLETHISGRRTDIVIKNIGLERSHRVEAHGHSGGI